MIRIATPEDLSFVYSLYMHPEVNGFLLYEMMDEPSFALIYQNLLNTGIKFIYTENDRALGMFKLIPLNFRTSHIAYLGGLAIDPAFAGKGYGKKMLLEIIEFAGNLGFLRIELSVADTNEKAIQLYEKAGFQKEGLLRKYSFLKSENKFLDEILMAYLS